MPPSRPPRLLMCDICGREFGKSSFPIHRPQCWAKRKAQMDLLEPHLRTPMPPKEMPTDLLKPKSDDPTQMQYDNEAASKAYESMLAPCPNCGRTFFPERLPIHLRSCRPGSTALPVGAKRAGRGGGALPEQASPSSFSGGYLDAEDDDRQFQLSPSATIQPRVSTLRKTPSPSPNFSKTSPITTSSHSQTHSISSTPKKSTNSVIKPIKPAIQSQPRAKSPLPASNEYTTNSPISSANTISTPAAATAPETVSASPSKTPAKFCVMCGARFQVETHRFCGECGTARGFI